MGFLDRLFRGNASEPRDTANESKLTDEQALERYRYLLRTAPPEAIEQAHAEAFAQLTPEQRAQVLKELSQELPPSERAAVPTQPDPQSLARLATRAELRQPGILERIFGGPRMSGLGGGMGGMFGGSLLTSIAGGFIGSAIAHQLLGGFHGGWRNETGDDDHERDWNEGDDEPASDDSDFGDPGGGVGGDFGDV